MAYENPNVEKTFTYPIPNEWRSTDFSDGKTGTFTYKGPRYLTFEINSDPNSDDYGKESGWCLTSEIELERPCPLDCVRITVDCTLNDENALLCEIGNDCGDMAQVEFRTNRVWKILHKGPPGYSHTYYTDEFEPRDIYDEFNITYDFDTGKFNLPVKGWENEGPTDLTWDDVRAVRDKQLEDTDGKISDDMPESIQNEWKEFRRLLRELPTALAEFEPWVAAKMFPPIPGGVKVRTVGEGIKPE